MKMEEKLDAMTKWMKPCRNRKVCSTYLLNKVCYHASRHISNPQCTGIVGYCPECVPEGKKKK